MSRGGQKDWIVHKRKPASLSLSPSGLNFEGTALSTDGPAPDEAAPAGQAYDLLQTPSSQTAAPLCKFLGKEVIQPQVLLRLPCYDFTPVINTGLDACSPLPGWRNVFCRCQLPWCDGRCVQGPGTYSPRHAVARLLAIPPSCSRVADCNPN